MWPFHSHKLSTNHEPNSINAGKDQGFNLVQHPISNGGQIPPQKAHKRSTKVVNYLLIFTFTSHQTVFRWIFGEMSKRHSSDYLKPWYASHALNHVLLHKGRKTAGLRNHQLTLSWIPFSTVVIWCLKGRKGYPFIQKYISVFCGAFSYKCIEQKFANLPWSQRPSFMVASLPGSSGHHQVKSCR